MTDGRVPIVTKDEMIDLDVRMIEEYGIPLEIMMENAGKSLAELTKRLYPGEHSVSVLVGPGNNGGGGVVAGRHLLNWGRNVIFLLSQWQKDVEGMLKEQLGVLAHTGIDVVETLELDEKALSQMCQRSGVVLDALLGYNIDGNPKGEINRLIRVLNKTKKKVISLDVPSGLSPDDGVMYEPVVRATATMTIAASKRGLQTVGAEDYVGDLYLADISVPFEWYQEHGMVNSPFEEDFIIRL